jgi:hypothetical protein
MLTTSRLAALALALVLAAAATAPAAAVPHARGGALLVGGQEEVRRGVSCVVCDCR